MSATLTAAIWDWFLGDGRATVPDPDGTMGTADWHLRHECGVDTTSSLPVPAVLPEDRSPVGVATPGTLAKSVSCRCGHITADLFTTAMLPLADLLAAQGEDDAERQVFMVSADDEEGHTVIEAAFATEAVAREYADQFVEPERVQVYPQPVRTVAPRRHVNYSLTMLFRDNRDTAVAGVDPLPEDRGITPLVDEFDEDTPYTSGRTTERVVTTTTPQGACLVVRTVGTDRDAVIEAFRAAVNGEIERARDAVDQVRRAAGPAPF